VGEIFRWVLRFSSQEFAWALSALEVLLKVALGAVLWVLIPGLVLWLAILGIVFVWRRVGKLGRTLTLVAGLAVVWFEWNLLAAVLAVTGAFSWADHLGGALYLLFVGACFWITVGVCSQSLVGWLNSWLVPDEGGEQDEGA